jgi:hypothetical protein
LAKDAAEPRAIDKPENDLIVEIPDGRTSSSIRATRRLAGLVRNILLPLFGLFAWAQLRPEVSGQREFSMIQGRRLPDHEVFHLNVLIDLAE